MERQPMMFRRLMSDVHHAVLIVVEDTPRLLRPFHYLGWWLWVGWKIPILMLYEGDMDDQEHTQRWPR